MTFADVLPLILQIPNWAGFLLLAYFMNQNNVRLLGIIERQQQQINALKADVDAVK